MLATFLATTMILVFVVANVARRRRTGSIFSRGSASLLASCAAVFVGGATSANGLFHFAHGVLGYGEFPAPFARIVAGAVFSDISNVIWGLLNFSVSMFVTVAYRKALPKWAFVVCFVVGFVTIALLLRFVLLVGYFQAHAF